MARPTDATLIRKAPRWTPTDTGAAIAILQTKNSLELPSYRPTNAFAH